MSTQTIDRPARQRVVSRDEWLSQRKALLAREKELTRLGDQIAAERRDLPWVRVDKAYTFETPEGRRTLLASTRDHAAKIQELFLDELTEQDRTVLLDVTRRVMERLNPPACDLDAELAAPRDSGSSAA